MLSRSLRACVAATDNDFTARRPAAPAPDAEQDGERLASVSLCLSHPRAAAATRASRWSSTRRRSWQPSACTQAGVA